VGDKKMRGELGDAYTEQLRRTFQGRVPGAADLVCYWFEKARAQTEAGRLSRAGLVATNSIRGGKNREVLDRICDTTRIFEAWSDEPWVNNGAAVRVSLVAFGQSAQAPMLDSVEVARISADLGSAAETAADLTDAKPLRENRAASFIGGMKKGQFDIDGHVARHWLQQPNPNRLSNALVITPWLNGLDITRRPLDAWIVDFGLDMPVSEARQFESPFAHVLAVVKPARDLARNTIERDRWWLHARPAPDLRRAVGLLARFIVTARVAKHRLFRWVRPPVVIDGQLVVIARGDDATLGVLHSRLHEQWSLRLGTSLEDRPRYTPTTTFETFPFPAGLTPADTAHQRTESLAGGALIPTGLAPETRDHAEAIACAAKRLVDLRDAWLNPPEWTERVPEVVPLGMTVSPYPDRVVARPDFEQELAKRTLTNLYNQGPAWLAQAHAALDAAVAAAYGWVDWTTAMADDEILRRLLALNLERAARETQ
jgi:type II restriction/modification system DNA methylase subunit YeeA